MRAFRVRRKRRWGQIQRPSTPLSGGVLLSAASNETVVRMFPGALWSLDALHPRFIEDPDLNLIIHQSGNATVLSAVVRARSAEERRNVYRWWVLGDTSGSIYLTMRWHPRVQVWVQLTGSWSWRGSRSERQQQYLREHEVTERRTTPDP